ATRGEFRLGRDPHRMAVPADIAWAGADRIVFQPGDPRPHQLDEANAMFHGRFRLGGKVIHAREHSIFDVARNDAGAAAELHGFEWLRHLEGAGGEAARVLALKLAQDWLARNARYSRPAWQPEHMATR